MFNRFDILSAYYVYGSENHAGQWTKEYAYIGRVLNCGFRPADSLSYESLSDNGKEIHDGLVLPSPNGTNSLWEETHAALCAGEWSKARKLLDDLGQRSDVVDLLLDLSQYERASGKTLSVDFRPVIQDRIDLVNSKIETHHPTV